MPDPALSLVKSHASPPDAGPVTLLERKAALDALAGIAGEARSGEGRLVLLEGEAGVGKSALLEQFTHDLPGVRLLSGACDGMFTPRPLGPLFDIAQQVHGRLRSLCRADASREQLFDALLTELCELVISPKTVGHHVSSVLAKLGVSKRTEVAAAMLAAASSKAAEPH